MDRAEFQNRMKSAAIGNNKKLLFDLRNEDPILFDSICKELKGKKAQPEIRRKPKSKSELRREAYMEKVREKNRAK